MYCSSCLTIAHRNVLVFQAGPTSVRWHNHVPRSPVTVARGDATLRRTCKQCGKTLTTEQALKYHVAMHEGQYRYHCQFCGRGFSSTTNLKGRLVQHTGVKYFACHIMQEGIHVRQHANETHSKVSCNKRKPSAPVDLIIGNN